MKTPWKYTRKDKIIISVIIGVMSATGSGLLIAAANSSALDNMSDTTRIGTGFANYGNVIYPKSETYNKEMSYAEYINATDVQLVERYQILSNMLSKASESSNEYRLIKEWLTATADHIGSLNTSFAFLIIGSIIVGISGISLIGWGSSLMFMGKSDS